MSDELAEARAKRRARMGLAAERAVLLEDVVKEADTSCESCGGNGITMIEGEQALCACAHENFQRRRGHQTKLRGEVAYWLKGCPRG